MTAANTANDSHISTPREHIQELRHRVAAYAHEYYARPRAQLPQPWRARTIRKAIVASTNVRVNIVYAWRRGIMHDVAGPPVFIVGCGHSGTSLLLAILGSHSNLHAVPFESNLGFMSDSDRRAISKRFGKLAVCAGKRRWVEKTPRHIHRVPSLLETDPEARTVIIVRDGRDVACSIKARYGDLALGIRRWVEDNRAGEAFWQHPRVTVIRYEDIVEDFHTAVLSVMRLIGERYEEGMERYHEKPKRYYARRISKPSSPKAHSQHRNWQINQPLYDGRGRWRREMTESDVALFKQLAGDTLIHYGYECNNSW